MPTWLCACALPSIPAPPLCFRPSLTLGLCPSFPGSDSVFLLSGRWEALWPTPPLAACRPAPSAVPTFPLPGPRGAGPPQATAGLAPVPGGGLEPFQTRNAFGLLDFEMAIYHHI